jgi:hypothetical protein
VLQEIQRGPVHDKCYPTGIDIILIENYGPQIMKFGGEKKKMLSENRQT